MNILRILKRKKVTFSGCPWECYHYRFMYIAPSSSHSLLNLNVPFKLILRRFDVVFWCLEWDCCTFQKIDENSIQIHQYYTGWPKKNATLTINNFKKTRDRMKKLCASSRIKFFSQQDDTKNANFDEGVLILWPLFWCNVIFKICTSISKVTIYVPKIFHCLASPGKVSALVL